MFGSSNSSPATSPKEAPGPVDGANSSTGAIETGMSASAPTSNPSMPPPVLSSSPVTTAPRPIMNDKRSSNGSFNAPLPSPSSGVRSSPDPTGNKDDKKRRSSSVGQKASSFLASAKNSLHFSPSPNSVGFGLSKSNASTETSQTPLQKLGKQDPALSVPQGQHNNSAGESLPGPRSTFRVGVWEDKNKKCRRTMEDTHAFLYNFLWTPAPSITSTDKSGSPTPKSQQSNNVAVDSSTNSLGSGAQGDMTETDNGYFAIFDGHAGTFAADWCGKKLHHVLEQMIRENPNTPIPELLDLTFTSVDAQLEKLPLKNSGCTAVCAVLRWEDRIPNSSSATGSTAIAPSVVAAVRRAEEVAKQEEKMSKKKVKSSPVKSPEPMTEAQKEANSNPVEATAYEVAASTHSGLSTSEVAHQRLKQQSTRQRVLYTANVGDARIVLCRNGKALRLSYDHKGSDENEGKRVANAGGLILNNRVNGVLAVTRALGDAYMKDLVTGHPYTTETVVQPELDEFIILACDGLWDVCTDQEAVDLVRSIQDPVTASKTLVDHALARFSTDNLSCMIVRLNKVALADVVTNHETEARGVEGDPIGWGGGNIEGSPEAQRNAEGPKMSEADKIVAEARRKVEEGGDSSGISGSNSGKGHDPRGDEMPLGGMGKVIEEVEAEDRAKPSQGSAGKKEVSPSRSSQKSEVEGKSKRTSSWGFKRSPTGSPPK